MATKLHGEAVAARDAEVRRMCAEGTKIREIAARFGCSTQNIDRILRSPKPPRVPEKSTAIADLPTPILVRELNRRRAAVARGTCDYCGRDLDSEPHCKYRERHYRIGMQPRVQPRAQP